MNKTNLLLVLTMIFVNPINVFASDSVECVTMTARLEREVQKAQAKLNEKKLDVQMYAAKAEETREISRTALILAETVAVVLTVGWSREAMAWKSAAEYGKGTYVSKILSNPWLDSTMVKLANYPNTLRFLINAPIYATIVIASRLGWIGIEHASDHVAQRILNKTLTIQELIDVNKLFDQAQTKLDIQRNSLYLDYPALTNVLTLWTVQHGARNELLEVAKESLEIEEMRLSHFLISADAVKLACSAAN